MRTVLVVTFGLSAGLCVFLTGNVLAALAGGLVVTALVAVVLLPDRG